MGGSSPALIVGSCTMEGVGSGEGEGLIVGEGAEVGIIEGLGAGLRDRGGAIVDEGIEEEDDCQIT